MHLVLIGFLALIATELVLYSNACGCKVPPRAPCGYLPPNQPARQQIYAGKLAEEGQWPWLAVVLQKTTRGTHFLCAGAIIDPEWILTAAHCLRSDRVSDYCVVVGHKDITDVDYDKCTPHGKRPLQLFRHPNYNYTAFHYDHSHSYSDQEKQARYHDIALLKMAKMSFDSADVGPVCLPKSNQLSVYQKARPGNYTDQWCHTAGWGDTETGSESRHLKSLKSVLWSDSRCQRSVYGQRNFIDNFYCFGGWGDGNICHGDSGAPLFCERPNGQFEAVGVASFIGYRGCTKDGGIESAIASYFVRIPTFVEWINSTMEAESEWAKKCLREWFPIPKQSG